MSEERKAAERLVVKGLAGVILIAAAFWAIPVFWDKLSPFIIAVPLAALLQPVIRFMQEKMKIRRGIAVLLCVLLILSAMSAFTYWAISIITEQAPQVVGQSGSMITEAVASLQQAVENLMSQTPDNVNPAVREILRNAAGSALGRVSAWGTEVAASIVSFTVSLVTGLPYGVIYISFLAMALYFIALHYEDIRSYLPGGKRRRQDSNTTQLTNSALRSLVGYLKVQGTFAIMVLVVSLIALNCFRFRYAGALSMTAGLMEMIPMIGSGLMYILMGVVFLLIGDTVSAVQVLVLTGVLQLLRRILEPKLMSDNIGISPLLSLVGMFVGMRIGGIVGLIGGPVAMAVLVGAVRGDVFKGINDDLYTVVQWFKRRWAKEPPAPAALPLPGGGPEAAPAPETAPPPDTAQPAPEKCVPPSGRQKK